MNYFSVVKYLYVTGLTKSIYRIFATAVFDNVKSLKS